MFIKNLSITLFALLLLSTAADILENSDEAAEFDDDLVDHSDAELFFDDDELISEENERHRQLWVKPAWYDMLSSEFTGYPPLKRCFKRTEPPVNGTTCGGKPKTCFFGDLQCSEGPAPDTKCVCNDRVWICEESLCPSCPVVINNPPQCPEEPPSNFGGPCPPGSGDEPYYSCSWGQEEW